MDGETQKIIEEQMKKLPADVKEAIISVDYQEKLQEITKRQKLLIDQAGKLEMETTLVMIGLEPLTDYIENIQRELGVQIMQAKEIAMDVSENIFKPIRDSLRQMNEAEEEVGGGDGLQVPGVRSEEEERPVTKFTNSNEANLNRDQILKEIEDPSLIEGGQPTTKTSPSEETKIEIRPAQTLETIPGQEVKNVQKDIKNESILQAKMSGPTTSSREIIDAKPETKLPEVKKRPTSGIDPYREPLS